MAAIEASLRLEIAQLQSALAQAKGQVAKFKEDLKKNSADMQEAAFGRPADWNIGKANLAGFRQSLMQEGEAGGGMMGTGMLTGMAKRMGPAAVVLAIGAGIKSAVQ